MTMIPKNKMISLLFVSLLVFALTLGLAGCSGDKNPGAGEATTEAVKEKTDEASLDKDADQAEEKTDAAAAETDADSTEQLSEEEEKSLEVAGEIDEDTKQKEMTGEEATVDSSQVESVGEEASSDSSKVESAGEEAAPDSGQVESAGEEPSSGSGMVDSAGEEGSSNSGKNKNRVYVFVNDVQDFCFYVPEAYKDKTMTYGDGGAVVYTGDSTDHAPYYTINRYKTDKGAYVYALWEAMEIEDKYAKYLAGPGVSPELVANAAPRQVYRVKADYLDPDSGRGMQEFIYVEQLKDGVIVYKTKYYTDDKENVAATQNAVNLAINNICMSKDYDPDHLGPNHIGIPEK